MNKKVARPQEGKKRKGPARRQAAPAPATPVTVAETAPLAALDFVDPTLQRQLISRVQRTHGNQQTGRLIAQHQTAPTIQRAPAAPTQAGQEAIAKRSTTRVNKILKGMNKSKTDITRNTAQLFTTTGAGNKTRLDFKTMTVRSDSATLLAAAGHDATKYDYFFYGETQDNKHLSGKRTIGTVEGDSTLIIRERDSSGTKQSKTDLVSTIVHEASHMLTEVYGDFPNSTGDADSFDRYKDEFRAYWIEPVGPWAKITNKNKKAKQIKKHLVGTSATSTKGYKQLRAKYWSDAAFKALVDAHTRPDGYNLEHNPILDRLAVLISEVKAGTKTVDHVLLHVVRYMSPAERKEAVENDYFKIGNKAYTDLGAPGFVRVKNTLRDLAKEWFDKKLNPNNSRKMGYFLSAIAVAEETPIQVTYDGLSKAEKGRLRYDASAYLVFTDQRISDLMMRAAVYALMTGYGRGQYNATKRLLEACERAKTDGDTAMPADIRAAFNKMTIESRLSLYRLAEPARKKYVDVLPAAISKPLLKGLRADSDTI